MGVCVTVIDDGRPSYLAQAMAGLTEHFPKWPMDRFVLVNDAGDADYADYLRNEYPQFDLQIHHETRRGLAGALRSAWTAALDFGTEFIFHQIGRAHV